MQQRHASGVVDLLRENMHLRAELAALVRILEARELTGEFSGSWRNLLKTARSTQPYRSLAHRYDDLIERVSETSTRAQMDHLLESVELHEPLP
jgi:hypothetical protein